MTHGAPAAKKNADGDEEVDVIPPPDGGWGWAVILNYKHFLIIFLIN